MKNRVLSLFLALTLILSLFPAQAAAAPTASGTCGAGGDGSAATWTLENGVLTISGQGGIQNNSDWVQHRDEIRKIVVKEGITFLYYFTFDYLNQVEEVSLPETLTTMQSGCFGDCTALKQLHLPASLTTINDEICEGCSSLTAITVAAGNSDFYARDGVLFRKSDGTLLHYPAAKPDRTYCVPDGVRRIGTSIAAPFRETRYLKAIGIPRSVKNDADSRNQFLTPQSLTDIYYEGTRQEWDASFDTPAQVALHCNWTYGAPLNLSRFPIRSDNNNDQSYGRWADTVKSYLHVETDNTLSRVEAVDGAVILERYNADRDLIEQRKIVDLSKELPLFGGCYFGTEQNFLVFGQPNPTEQDSVEVFRVVSYTKDWQRLKDTRICGANTSVPFDAGSLRMVQYGDYLYIHTCHKMYRSSDGLNHQANVTLNIHIPTMELRDHFWDVYNISNGYVSHSFNQFILLDGKKVLTLDHGDAYPRSVVLVEYVRPAGQDRLMGAVNYTDLLPISGGIGNNTTGVTVGGFELSDSSYLAAGTTVDQSAGDLVGQRNIFLSVLPRGTVGSGTPKQILLTHHKEGAERVLSTPHLVKLNEDRFLVLWTEGTQPDIFTYVPGPLCWQVVDGSGTPVGPTYQDQTGRLSDCKPVLQNGKVVWYVTEESAPVFYSIDPAHPQQLKVTNALKSYTVTVDGTQYPDIMSGTTLGDILPKNPTRDGQTFRGWFVGDTQVNENTPVTGDMTVVSKWDTKTYTVTIDGKAHTVKHGSKLGDILPQNPTKPGQNFSGWFVGGTQVDENTVVTGNMTVVSKWDTKTYTVTIDGKAHTVAHGSKLCDILPQNPTKPGQNFSGWFVGGTQVDENTVVTGDMTVVSKWDTKTYTVTIDGKAHTVAHGSKLGDILPKNPSKPGQNFSGWFVGGTQVDENTVVTGNMTVVSKWDTKTYTVTIDGKAHTVAHGSKLGDILPQNPTNPGQNFSGWFVGGTQVDENTLVTGNMTVVSKWDTKTYTVTIDGKAHTVAHGSKLGDILPKNPTKPGQNFSGWFVGGTQVNGNTLVTGDMTVVSKWDTKTYTVIIDGKAHTVAHGSKLGEVLPQLPPKAGHSLVWYEDGQPVDPGTAVQRDMALTSGWRFDRFTDVKEGDWFYEGVRYTTFKGLFSGISSITFGPKLTMTRSMVVQVLYSMAGKPPVEKNYQFPDVKPTEWYADAVAWAVENGVSSGYANGCFGTEDEVNREQLAVMLHGFMGKPASEFPLTFADADSISGWARAAMQWAVEQHMMGGVPGNKILPQGLAERSQGAVIIMNFDNLNP